MYCNPPIPHGHIEVIYMYIMEVNPVKAELTKEIREYFVI
jgi:hypothetical protein